jgi:integral membrane sensor domain MASE1
VSFLLAHLSVLVGKLTPTELAYIWVPLTGLYFTGVKEAEKKWPSWTWLLYLLPTKLP